MTKYRKKPITVEAEQFWPDKPLPFRDYGPVVEFDGTDFFVVTIHDQRAYLASGDWVILELPGEFFAYPCKPDIFEQIYEVIP